MGYLLDIDVTLTAENCDQIFSKLLYRYLRGERDTNGQDVLNSQGSDYSDEATLDIKDAVNTLAEGLKPPAGIFSAAGRETWRASLRPTLSDRLGRFDPLGTGSVPYFLGAKAVKNAVLSVIAEALEAGHD